MKTIAQLNTRWWYRALKVCCIFFWLVTASVGSFVSGIFDNVEESSRRAYHTGESWGTFCLLMMGCLVAFQLAKMSFHYVVAGSVNPPKD
jgi:hypothetical protein